MSLVWLLLAIGCGSPPAPEQAVSAPPAADAPQEAKTAETDDVEVAMTETDVPEPEIAPGDTRIEMRDCELEQPGGLTRVRYLAGTIQTTNKGKPPVIDNPKGYMIMVEKAEVAIDWRTLGALMSKPKDGEKPPLADATFSETEDGLLVIESQKPVPFRMKSEVGVDPKGRLTIRLVTLEALGVGTKLFRKTLGIKLEDIIKDDKGVTVDGDTVHIDPLADSPPPKVRGKLIAVSVEKDGLVLRLGATGVDVEKETASLSVASAADGPKSNYLSFKGGTLISGNVTIRRADITLHDQDPTDAFRLGANTQPQVEAGYLRQLGKGKIGIFAPDNNDIASAKKQP